MDHLLNFDKRRFLASFGLHIGSSCNLEIMIQIKLSAAETELEISYAEGKDVASSPNCGIRSDTVGEILAVCQCHVGLISF